MAEIEENEIKSTISDGCPSWAVSLIHKIYVLELESGNIKESSDKAWFTTNQEKLLKIASHLDDSVGARQDVDKNADMLFAHVVQGLRSENFSAKQIADFINSRIPTGTKLLYCNEEEVLNHLK